MELAKVYSAKEVEEKWYTFWEKGGYFAPDLKRKGKSYVIVIPPPNVTGILHMGHALNNSIQDILTRWHRMRGEPTLWVPGTDHAGIATQNVVERQIKKEGLRRQDLGREKFIERVWKWREEYGTTIIKQLKRLGSSCDWSRTRFTMDEGLSKAVREAFVTLYEDGLIYRGLYLINWCPRCRTALSDEEAASKEVSGKLYYYYYWVVNSKTGKKEIDEKVFVATTRPETMLGDTALAINPGDERHQALLKKKVILPLLERELKVIKDDYVDKEFGSGIVKITPAHDPNDYSMGERHGLEKINILTEDAHINENGGKYKGLDRFEARKKIIEDLKEHGLFIKEDDIRHNVPHCYRCDSVVEPYLSEQWFVKMKPLAALALKALDKEESKFVPQRWLKVYRNWLENIRDWCISRQIWWGHRIPVWYCEKCPKPIASRTDIKQCLNCGSDKIRQDEDVLDTWFSSWLWPFSTLGWPDKNSPDLTKFYPTTDLVTAPEILFFWVARMIMAGLYFMKEVPFTTTYLHGTVRADSGQKMSKSLGNAIDPLELINEIGADALRFSTIMLTASGQDAYLSRQKFELGRNFTNKIWNASRFVLTQLEGFKGKATPGKDDALNDVDRWILARFNRLTREVNEALTSYRFNEAATQIYQFIWNDFCDWYLELSKPRMALGGESKRVTQTVLLSILERSLRILHPFMPFITEEIWQLLKNYSTDSWDPTIMISAWPAPEKSWEFEESESAVELFKEAVVGIRDLRARFSVPPKEKVRVVIKTKTDKAAKYLSRFSEEIKQTAQLSTCEMKKDFERAPGAVQRVLSDIEIFLFVEGLVDLEKERTRMETELASTQNRLTGIRVRLSNKQFVDKAPEDVIESERTREKELETLIKDLEQSLAGLKG